MMEQHTCDVAVVGGGAVGCVAALAFASRNARVLVLEATANATSRFAGEWLHPPAVETLRRFGIELPVEEYASGKGFAVFPRDGSDPVVLPYEGRPGISVRHERLIAALRKALPRHSVEFLYDAKVSHVTPGRLMYERRSGSSHTARAERIVCASGRNGAVHRSLGVTAGGTLLSRMAGVVLTDVELPYEGFGHVFVGAPGPVLAYRIAKNEIRLCLDVPLSFANGADKLARLYEHYAPVLPASLRGPLYRALRRGEPEWATNAFRRRKAFGLAAVSLVGDAVGYFHPLTAAGMTVGFRDALELASGTSFDDCVERRLRDSAVPAILAAALYDVFSGTTEGALELQAAIFGSWRASAAERRHTMRLLSCDETNPLAFGASLFGTTALAVAGTVATSLKAGSPSYGARVARELGSSLRGWMAQEDPSVHHPRNVRPVHPSTNESRSHALSSRASARDAGAATLALRRGVRALVALQSEDGSWEGECTWCPLISAEYVLAWHLMGRPLPEARRDRLLLHFRKTRLAGGLWGLSDVSPPSLFVTTLVYVACRLLGTAPDDPMLAAARRFFAAEGVASIPTWGKFWLSMLSLYRWEGVNPVVPEIWELPRALPVHPSRYYCHTRLIYVAMSVLYADRFQPEPGPLVEALREELYPGGFDGVDFAAARSALRRGDLFEPPHPVLAGGYAVLRWVDAVATRQRRRRRLLATLRESMKWELRVTNHAAISPVSGLLTMLALFANDPGDADLARAIERFDCWIWDDEREGARVSGARTPVWDTSFALQALYAAPALDGVEQAVRNGVKSLEAHQIRDSFADYFVHHRADPCGGYPLSGLWQGWPVSDVTAEALVARLEAPGPSPSDHDVAIAAGFILRMQGADGGFGSYEPRRVPFSIEWLNPAEMFGDCMTESGYVECTASCLAALSKIAAARPHLLARADLRGIPRAIARGAAAIRRLQRPSGAWDGAWGIRFLYGTWFGVRGLLAAGASPRDGAVLRACEWLKSRQRSDGSWGERHDPQATDYVEHASGQVVQTAWALLTLCEAEDPEFDVLERAARFLSRAQLGSGEWPREDPAGVFFRTAPLDYQLYRSYFPIWALGAYEARRASRARLLRGVVFERAAVTASEESAQ